MQPADIFLARLGEALMAEILMFRARPRSAHEVGPQRGECATILFFTGVRYMRMDDVEPIETGVRKAPRRSGKSPTPRRTPRKRA